MDPFTDKLSLVRNVAFPENERLSIVVIPLAPMVNLPSTVINPSKLTVLPAPVGVVSPAKNALSEIVLVVAVNPAVFTCAPLLNKMPFGLTRNTRPFDCRLPKMEDTLCVVTRLSTALALVGCVKRVVSPAPMEKPCQLIMVLGALVTVRVVPLVTNIALPFITVGPMGLAHACEPHAA